MFQASEILLVCLGLRAGAVTFVVTNTTSQGPGSLYDAMQAGVTSVPPVRITFAIPGAAPFVIARSSTFGVLEQGVSIDASTQPGYAGTPLVQLVYTGPTGTADNAMTLYGENLVRGLNISGFAGSGLHLTESVDVNSNPRLASNVVIAGCWLVSNRNSGIYAFKPANCTFGGSAASNRNVMSGNGYYGVYILGGHDVSVMGNYVGLSPTNSTRALPNGSDGVYVEQCPGSMILGFSAARQVISGNAYYGVHVSSAANDVIVRGNYIGTDAAGTIAVSNRFGGISVSYANGVVIGGTNVEDRNVVSGNLGDGIRVDSPGSTGIVIQGNFVGTRANGLNALSNNVSGISLYGVNGALVGGANTNAGNLICANGGSGIQMNGSNSVVSGNRVGLSLSGVDLGNGGVGIAVSGTSNTIGSSVSVAANVVCGNSDSGIEISYGSGNTVVGNMVGVDAAGNLRPNDSHGVHLLFAVSNRIGGTVPGSRNVVSGNGAHGFLIDAGSVGNVIEGNFIGVNASGSSMVTNGIDGVRLRGATNNLVGGTNVLSRNLISGNPNSGIYIEPDAPSNSVLGNYIGTDVNGLYALPNGSSGYGGIWAQGAGTVIGGSGCGNLISGNEGDGVFIWTTNAVVQGNIIGLSADGSFAIPNGATNSGASGVYVTDARGTRIGGSQPGEGNTISGSWGYELELWKAVGTTIQGNRIGFDPAAMATFSNHHEAVYVLDSSSNLIGGATSGARNFIFSPSVGIDLGLTNAHHNVIQGNWINIDTAGQIASASSSVGVAIGVVQGQSNTIGGAGAGNVVFARGSFISLSGSNCAGNVVRGNLLGVGPDGVSPRRASTNLAVNAGTGIHLTYAVRNTIGGTNAGEGNIIANVAYGVAIFGTNAQRNAVLGNRIYDVFFNGLPNAGIDLGPNLAGLDGSTANDVVPDTDGGANGLQNFPVITNAISLIAATRVQGYLASVPSKTFRLEFFRADTNAAEGRYLLGAGSLATAASGTGTFSIVLNGWCPTSRWLTATATDTNDNTSEFSFPAVKPVAAADTDGDLMPDFWESQYGLNPAVSNAPGSDADNDRFPDVREFFAATIPNNAASYLAVDDLALGPTNLVTFLSSPYRNYHVEFAAAVTNGALWSVAYSNAPGNGLAITVPVATSPTQRFHRVIAFPPP